jgi:hypothetical protein
MQGVVMESVQSIQPRYVPVSVLAKTWGRSKMYIYRRIDMIRNEGKFDQICLQLGPQQTLVNVDKFEVWMKGQHMKWLKGA